MQGDMSQNRPSPTGRTRYLFLAGAIMTYLVVTMGGIVCVTGGSTGCPDWPGCYGQIVPPARIDSLIEYTHRLIGALTAPVLLAAAVVAWRRYRSRAWVLWPATLAILFLLAVVGFGATLILRGLSPLGAVLDISSALTALGLTVVAAVSALQPQATPARPSFHTPFARLVLAALAGVFVVLASAVLVARSGSVVRCLGWPLYGSGAALADVKDWLQMGRAILGGLVSLLLLAVVVQSWRLGRAGARRSRGRAGAQRSRGRAGAWRSQGGLPIPAVATAMGLLFLVETGLGLFMALRGLNDVLLLLYVPIMAATYVLLVALAMLAGLLSAAPAAAPTGAGAGQEAPQPSPTITYQAR
jgi:heme A synthase